MTAFTLKHKAWGLVELGTPTPESRLGMKWKLLPKKLASPHSVYEARATPSDTWDNSKPFVYSVERDGWLGR